MSGIEVAGIVLATFPLVISALEHSRSGAKIWKNWWRHERAYKNFQYEIECEQRRFEQNIELYLLPLITDDDALLQYLLENPGGQKWQEKGLETRLKERIPENYDLYFRTIKEMNEVMAHMREKLERRRFKFALSELSRNELLEHMSRYNKRLQELLDISDRVTSLKHSQGVTKTSKGMSQFWVHTNTLYSMLLNAWKCRCYDTHHANLRLQHRAKACLDFNVFFLFENVMVKENSSLWNWHESDIKSVEKDAKHQTVKFSLTDESLKPNQHNQNHANHDITTKRARVHESALKQSNEKPKQPTPSSRSKPTFIAVESPSDTNNDQTHGLDEITDLCSTIADCQSASCLGLLKGEETWLSLTPKPMDSAPEIVTLDLILSNSSPLVLTRRDRYFIALSLASSHLQLHSTPWLGSRWRKNEVNVHLERDKSGHICKVQPYISRNFNLANSPRAEYAMTGGDFSFSTLGIILLELCFGKPFEDYDLRKRLGSTDPSLEPILDHTAAVQWCNEVAGETGVEYQDAVKWCLDMTFARNDEWRQEHFGRVIDPIRTCYNHLVDHRKVTRSPAMA